MPALQVETLNIANTFPSGHCATNKISKFWVGSSLKLRHTVVHHCQIATVNETIPASVHFIFKVCVRATRNSGHLFHTTPHKADLFETPSLQLGVDQHSSGFLQRHHVDRPIDSPQSFITILIHQLFVEVLESSFSVPRVSLY